MIFCFHVNFNINSIEKHRVIILDIE